MTVFGQAGVPQVYHDLTQRSFSKAGLLSHLCHAFDTVDMVPLRYLFPWDPIAEPERVVVDSSAVHLFPYDYPDVSTFSVDSVAWRPCVLIAAWFGDYGANTPSAQHYNKLIVLDAIRRDGDPALDNIFITNRHRSPATAHFGFGAGATTAFPRNLDGAYISVTNWKPDNAHAGAFNVNVLNVGNFYVYRGRAGLFVFVGSGNSRSQFGDHLSVGFVFGGGRIPDREITPDVNLNRINPIIPLYLKSQGTAVTPTNPGQDWQTTTQLMESVVHGIQHDQKGQLYPVRSQIYVLESVEWPVFPFYRPWTAPSPRNVGGGQGAHILGRLVQVPSSREDNDGDLYGPLQSQLSTGQVRPSWGEVFTAPGFRFCDLSAPLGLHEDPVTLTDWYLVPTYHTNQLLGLYYENANIVPALDTLTATLVGDNSYTLLGNPGFDFGSISGSLTAPVVAVSTTSAGAINWSDAHADDLVTCFNDPSSGAGSASATMEWTIDLGTADPVDTKYRFQFEMRNRDAAATEGLCPVVFEAFVLGSWVTLTTLLSAGTNVALDGYDYNVYEGDLQADSAVPGTRQLRVRWVATRTNSAAEGNTVSVRAFHILKYRYL